MNIGIEKICVYPGTLCYSMADLAKKRGVPNKHIQDELMVNLRSINPPFEDAVTMAVNAADLLLDEKDKSDIGLIIIGTESGVDQEKTISSWVQHYLSLPSECINFEIKSACFCTTAAIRMAEGWIRSGLSRGKKALIINSDQSLSALNKPYEFIGGGAAVAIIISDNPLFLALESNAFGQYSHEITDVVRPFPWLETGNSKASLFSYMEALEECYNNYLKHIGDCQLDFLSYFNFNIFHVPFPGISFRAFRNLLSFSNTATPVSLEALFKEKTLPAILLSQQIGSTYGGSIYLSLLSLALYADEIKNDQRVGIFSYGSGSCAEFYSAKFLGTTKAIAAKSRIKDQLDNRTLITFENYEEIEKTRTELAKSMNYKSNLDYFGKSWFEEVYVKKNQLVLSGINGYFRDYRRAQHC